MAWKKHIVGKLVFLCLISSPCWHPGTVACLVLRSTTSCTWPGTFIPGDAYSGISLQITAENIALQAHAFEILDNSSVSDIFQNIILNLHF